MADGVVRLFFAALLAGGILAIAVVAGDAATLSVTGSVTEAARYSVDWLMTERPIGETVMVDGRVVQVQEDHVSSAGNVYQRFTLADPDGTSAILVFCSTDQGRTTVSPGDAVTVTGTFKKYYDTYEIYMMCSDVLPT